MDLTTQMYCSHGLVQQMKLGFDVNDQGHQICRGCSLPTFESVPKPTGSFVMAAPAPVLVVTMNDIPGYRIDEVHGDVFGLIVRARNVFSNMGASVRTLVGGEVGGYTKLLADSRIQARERMMAEARNLGANAVVAMRFDCNEIGDVMSEVAAYGTAVTVTKLDLATRVD
jgi:uncharacterized protein YbjQ (UPF0145 family)